MGDDQVILILDDGNRLECSKKLLLKSSPYFEAMFSLGFSETEKKEVSIHGPLASATVEELLKHARGFQLGLSEDNALTLLQAAGMLQFEAARKTCNNFLKSTMRPSNLFKIFAASDLLGEAEIRKLALSRIIWNFVSTVAADSNNLSDLSFDLFKEVVDHPNLRISSELDVYQTISDWVDHDLDNRSKHFVELFKCLRIDQMSETDLSDLKNYHLVLDSEEAQAFIDSEILERKSEALRSNKLEQFVELDKVSMNETVYASGYQVVAAGPTIYVIGGEFMLGRSNWNKAVWSYDTITREWSHVLSLDIPRRHLSLCTSLSPPGHAEEGEIFLVGGFGKHRIILDLLDSINLTNKTLQECPVLPIQMYSPAVCMFRGRLFVLKNSIHYYHPDMDFWSNVSHYNFPKDVEFKKAMATKDFIYLTASHQKQLYRFDPDQTGSGDGEKLDFEVVGSFSRIPDNVCLIDDSSKVFSFSSDDNVAVVETYDLVSGEFEILLEDDSTNFRFASSSFSYGCFPLVTFDP